MTILFKQHPEKKVFYINTEYGKASFVKTRLEDGKNAHCLESKNGTYLKGQSYFILDEQIVYN